MTGERILVVEDEAAIADAVAARLRSVGYVVEVAVDGPLGLERFDEFTPALVVLDLNLPGLDGLEVCRRIQAKAAAGSRSTPVVMLTARDDETDIVVGLGVGADDYLTKPFSPRELVARVQAVLRRLGEQAVGPEPAARVIVGDVELEVASRRVFRSGAEVHLTPTEFDLLARLVARNGAVLTRDQLLHQVWGYRDGSGPRTVDSHVRAVRQKLGPDMIRTVHGIGYSVGDGAVGDGNPGS